MKKKTLKQKAKAWLEYQYEKDNDFEVCDECNIPKMAWIAGYKAGKRIRLKVGK